MNTTYSPSLNLMRLNRQSEAYVFNGDFNDILSIFFMTRLSLEISIIFIRMESSLRGYGRQAIEW
jgi:hypothetical protein